MARVLPAGELSFEERGLPAGVSGIAALNRGLGLVAGVVSQRLLPRAGGTGRVPACEIMVATPVIGNLIRENKMHQALSLMESSRSEGMRTMDAALAALHKAGTIDFAEAVRYARNPTAILQKPEPAGGAA